MFNVAMLMNSDRTLMSVSTLFTENASRFCHANGSWDNYTNYKACIDVPLEGQAETGVETATTLYFIGYSMSLVALSIAIGIFLYFK
jgi:corticotropin releasing hormone receptor 1